MKKNIPALLLSASMLSLVLCACGDESTPAETVSGSESTSPVREIVYGGEIVVGISQDLEDSLDPHKAVAAGTKEVLFNLFEGLVKPNAAGELIPAVAESYTIDGEVYSFTLRDGVRFHNGDLVTAEDVVYSIERCRADGVTNIPALSVIESVEAVDESTVVITIDEPNLEFLSYLTLAILPADYTQQDTQPVGTGPFRYVSRSAQDNLVIERFDEYWGEPAYLDKVTYRVLENADALVLALKSNTVDLCSHLTADQTAQLEGQFTILEGTMNLVQALYLNNAVEPLDNELVRQALCYAVDKQMIMDMIADGHGTAVGSSMYPAFEKYFVSELADAYPQNVEKAKELLTQAGYPDGFALEITVPSNYQPHMDTATVLAEQLRAIGVEATIVPVEWATWLEEVYMGRQYQSTVVGVDAAQMTARAMLERFTSTASDNFINYNNAEYDALFAKALAASDDAEQTELYRQMQVVLSETAANVYIQDMADLVAMDPALDGLVFYPVYVMDLSTVHYCG